MEKMSRKKALNTVFTVIFIGIILTFSLLFLTTATLTAENSISDSYFNGSEVERSIFSPFDDACLKNKSFYDLINEYEYRVFKDISDRDVICGDNGFLFNADTNDYGYNYIDDYTGKITLSRDQLDHFHKYVEMRSRAYENFGSKYVLAVIPNSQTVYGELMPSYLGEISENTVLSQVGEYLEMQDFVGFVDLSDAMNEGKQYGQLYNNTENTVNAMGAYVAYSGIIEYIKTVCDDEINLLAREHFELQTRITDGKALAKKVGLDSLIKNRTIYISDSNEHIYTLVELFGDFETTYTKYEYRPNASDTVVLIECAREWDKVQLMPYFSSTFSRASYRVTHKYSRSAVANLIPDVVVQVIREDELISVLDDDLAASYNDGLEPGQNPYKTTAAADIACTKIGERLYCVTGTVERGAKITLFGDGINPVTATELDGRFFAEVTVNNPSVATQICVSVHTEGKSISDISYAIISSEDKATKGSVLVGKGSMLYKNDYDVSPVPDDAVILNFNNKVKEYFGDINSSDTNTIFLLVPEKISVYEDSLSENLSADALDLQVKRMILNRALSQSGVLLIDGAEPLRARALLSKLYYQTYDKLTDTGSYYLYRELMTRISKEYPSAAPHPIDSGSYILTRRRMGAGELAEELGFTSRMLSETAVTIDVKGSFEFDHNYSGKIDMMGEFVTYKNDADLPSALVIRDGDSDKIVEMMADNFSMMYVLEKGATEIPEYVNLENFDYVIVIASEIDIDIE